MRRIAAAACLLALMTSLVEPAHADRERPRLHAPSVDQGRTAVLTGTVPRGADRVVLQRKKGGTWRKIRDVRPRGTRLEVSVRRSAGAAKKLRIRADGRTSKSRKVPRWTPPGPVCGAPVAKADGSPWVCTFADDFDGTALDRSVWLPATQFHSGELDGALACYHDTEDYVAVRDGLLHLSLRETAPAPCPYRPELTTTYAAGSVSTYGMFSQQYGRFEARYRSAPAAVPGLQEAFWLWPDVRYSSTHDWPVSGEIDIAETYSHHPDLAIPFLHYAADAYGPQPGLNTAWNCTARRGEFNTYTLVWEPARLEVLVNGRTCLVNTSGDPAFQKPYILALTQLLGSGDNAPTDETPLPATMQVDYVRVWS